jgi:hypothetical protein
MQTETKGMGFVAKKKSLFKKISSRGVELWYNSSLSDIKGKERYWLIVFNRPYARDAKWGSKFWVWDSEESKIIGENILTSRHEGVSELSAIYRNVAEAYLDREFERVVFRPQGKDLYLIYSFSGEKLNQTKFDTLASKPIEEKHSFSLFLSPQLFLAKVGKFMSLFTLGENLIPSEHRFVGTLPGIKYPNLKDFTFQFAEKYFAIIGLDDCAEAGGTRDTIWVYKKREFPRENHYDYLFLTKFTFQDAITNVTAEETCQGLDISFQYEITREVQPEGTHINLPAFLFR